MIQMNKSVKQTDSQTKRIDVWLPRGWGGGKDRKFGISRCQLSCREWISSKVLLQSTENYIPYPEMNHNGKEYEKECISLLNHWLTLLHSKNWPDTVNQPYSNLKNKRERGDNLKDTEPGLVKSAHRKVTGEKTKRYQHALKCGRSGFSILRVLLEKNFFFFFAGFIDFFGNLTSHFISCFIKIISLCHYLFITFMNI